MEDDMKRIMIIAVCAVLAVVLNIPLISAQKIHKSSDGITFIEESKKLYNKSYTAYPDSLFSTEGFQVTNPSLVADVVKNTLSPERLLQLKDKRMVVVVKCDTKGKILGLKFLFPKTKFLTIEEIGNIEKELSACHFDIISNLKNAYGIQFAVPYNFSKL